MVGNIPDIIMCAKFRNKNFRGYDLQGGIEFTILPIGFCMCLTTVLGYTVLPVMCKIAMMNTVRQSE